MSYECGECEMDLRRGHAPECSRYRPEKAVSGHLLENDIIRESDAEEVEQMVLHVLSGERERLRERVEGLPTDWMLGMQVVPLREVLALLAEPEGTDPVSSKGTPQCESEQ